MSWLNKHLPLMLLGVAVLWWVWQLIGLHHMNSDDNLYQLRAVMFFQRGISLDSIWDVITQKKRLRIFNTLIENVMGMLQERPIAYSILNAGSVVFFCLSLLLLLRQYLQTTAAALVVSVVSVLFPLHFYYTIPQSYPVEFIWSFAVFFLAMRLLDQALTSGQRRGLILGTLLYFLSLNGQEYTFVLFPVLVVCFVAYRMVTTGSRIPWRMVWSLASVQALYGTLFFMNYLVGRSAEASPTERMTISLDVGAWLSAFGMLMRSSILPIGLIDGISIRTFRTIGMPALPVKFTYGSFFTGHQDWLTMGVVLVIAAVGWYGFFRAVQLPVTAAQLLIGVGLCIAVIPAAIVTVSAYYQQVYARNGVNGHITTFYVHVGLCLVGIGLYGVMQHVLHTRAYQQAFRLITVVCIAVLTVVTLRYNVTNRSLMNAAIQRWEGMRIFVSYLERKPEAMNPGGFFSQTIRTRIAVAGAPGYFGKDVYNYWGVYTERVYGTRVQLVRDSPTRTSRFPRYEYRIMADGNPVVYHIVSPALSREVTLSVISQVRRAGAVTYQQQTHPIDPADWQCDVVCVVTYTMPRSSKELVPQFRAEEPEHSFLWQALMAPRGGYTEDFSMNMFDSTSRK